MQFLIPVRFTGTVNYPVDAPDLQAAIERVKTLADQTAENRELGFLRDLKKDVQAPVLSLTEEQATVWPYWSYGYHGIDGCDWRQYWTDKGPSAIPDFAETKNPVLPFGEDIGPVADARNHKTYATVQEAVEKFRCPGPCGPDCPLYDAVKLPSGAFGHKCHPWHVTAHPREVAALIGCAPVGPEGGSR